MEKHVVLAIGLALRQQLLRSNRCRVAMTRSTDVFVPLEGRVRFAQQQGAAVMISLHANSARDPRIRGANVYRFATHASDKDSAAVERIENSVVRFEGTKGQSVVVQRILSSLMRRETTLHSAGLQRDLVTDLDTKWHLCGGGARHARFVVLSAPNVASVLIETGFLTNPSDTAALSHPSHQLVLARTISGATSRFLATLPQARRTRRRP